MSSSSWALEELIFTAFLSFVSHQIPPEHVCSVSHTPYLRCLFSGDFSLSLNMIQMKTKEPEVDVVGLLKNIQNNLDYNVFNNINETDSSYCKA